MSTNKLSVKDIRRSWHLLDANKKILGRLSTEVALLLMGKNKVNYVPYLDMGDNVVIINAEKIVVTGKKADQKEYNRYSGYQGGRRVESFKELQERRPEDIIIHAVQGMLPRTKLAEDMIKKMHVYKGSEHPFKKKFTEKVEKTEGEKNGK
ncbi:MAG: 50S ribosomal protein L13 [Candidatus Daviesbacteria bacterium]|nr:50S ribosomal protein L13 [Candidatus Daviesbacteria bacterium]